jgi:glycerophosphoryl diester phosphodiesterase
MKNKFLVIAHRGFSEKYPENTLLAFEEALNLGAPAIELDVHLTKDQQLVVTHDFSFGRTIKAKGNVLDYTLTELCQMDAGSWKKKEFASEKIPSLEQVLKLINSKCLLNIEIKKETLVDKKAYETMILKLLSTVSFYDLKNILFSSFDPYALKVLREHSPQARIAYLDDRPDQGPKISEALSLKSECYNVSLKRLNQEIVADLQKAGLKVFSYTAKNMKDLELARGLGVDGVFADNLEDAQKL